MIDILVDHWPFAAASLILATVGQVSKRAFFTNEKVKRSAWSAVGRATLPLHPVLMGALLGFFGLPTSAGVDTLQGRVLYFAFAGVASAWGYAVVRGIAKTRGLKLELPGDSQYPPAMTLDDKLIAIGPFDTNYGPIVERVDVTPEGSRLKTTELRTKKETNDDNS